VNLLFFLINLKICVRYKFISIYLNYLWLFRYSVLCILP
jgi:hypothetical protein